MQFFETFAILVGNRHQRGQVIYRRFNIRCFILVYFQRVAGIVARQHHTVAVEYQAAIGDDGNDGNTIANWSPIA